MRTAVPGSIQGNYRIAELFLIQRLAPVVAKIDFYSSTATYCTFDGTAWKIEQLTTYKQLTGAE